MIEDVIPQTISGKRIVDEISPVGHPVFRELLRAQNKYIFVPSLVVFDDAQGGERLSKSHAVSKDTSVILFQLIDDCKGGVFLEVKQLPPDNAVLKAGGFVWQDILRNIFEKFAEDIVQRHKIHKFRRIFLIDRGNHINNLVCHIRQFFFVFPDGIEHSHKFRTGRILHSCDEIRDVIPSFTSEVNGRERVHGHIGVSFIRVSYEEAIIHAFACDVRLKTHLTAHPFGAFTSNGLLPQLITQADFKFCSVQALFTLQAGDIELPALFRRLFSHKSWGREDKAKFLTGFKLLLEFLIGINRKAGCRNGDTAARLYLLHQIITHNLGCIVKNVHTAPVRM